MIRKRSSFIFIALMLTLVLFVFIQLNKNNPLSIIKSLGLKNRLPVEGKITVFSVSYGGILPVGEAELVNKGAYLYQGRQVYHLQAKAMVSKFISKFFDTFAQVDSYIDKDKLHSLRFIQTLIIPDKPKDEKEVLYDQSNNIMELRGVKRQILPATQDPLSAMFYIQHQPLELGKEFDININTNQKNYRLYVKVIKREEYTIENKKIGVWVLQGDIRRRDKNPYHSSTMMLWLLDNPSNKIPILIKAMTDIGSVTARLIAVE